jgi:RHS repeat-associated protein
VGTVTQDVLFTGRTLDRETVIGGQSFGIYYYRARQYDPSLGRFLQRDPIGVWGDRSNSGNAYGYGGGDPENSRDRMGLDSYSEGVIEVSVDEGTLAEDTGNLKGISSREMEQFNSAWKAHGDDLMGFTFSRISVEEQSRAAHCECDKYLCIFLGEGYISYMAWLSVWIWVRGLGEVDTINHEYDHVDALEDKLDSLARESGSEKARAEQSGGANARGVVPGAHNPLPRQRNTGGWSWIGPTVLGSGETEEECLKRINDRLDAQARTVKGNMEWWVSLASKRIDTDHPWSLLPDPPVKDLYDPAFKMNLSREVGR